MWTPLRKRFFLTKIKVFFDPYTLAREGTNLSYIFEGMAHPSLHLSINLERQNALTEPR